MFNRAKKVIVQEATVEQMQLLQEVVTGQKADDGVTAPEATAMPSWGGFKDTTAIEAPAIEATEIDTGIPACLLRKQPEPEPSLVEVAPVEVQKIPTRVTAKKAAAAKARAEKAAKATATVETPVVEAPVSEFATETAMAILAIAPAKKARKAATKTTKVPAEKTPNERQAALFAVLENGATIKQIQEAGYIWAAAAVLKMAERNGYKTSIEKVDGRNRYFAKKA